MNDARLGGQLFRSIPRKLCSIAFANLVPTKVWNEHASWRSVVRGLSNLHFTETGSNDPVLELSQVLREKALKEFEELYSSHADLRVLIHMPSAQSSMGGNSLFGNWIDGITHMGVSCRAVNLGSDVMDVVEEFKPSVFFTSDHGLYLRWIDWGRLRKFREKHPMVLIFTASAERDGNSAEEPRLAFARRNGVDFFVSFREADYIREHLTAWTRAGFDVLSIPFSANPVRQFYWPFSPKPLDYVFLGSINPEKAFRYLVYFRNIVRRYHGIINGPGWGQDELIFERKLHPYAYALASIGVNLHIPISMDGNTEINERTFILAACGVFQLCDKPTVLRRFFSEKAVVAASGAKDYEELFEYYVARPDIRQSFQLQALREVYVNNTVFHRMAMLLDKSLEVLNQKKVG